MTHSNRKLFTYVHSSPLALSSAQTQDTKCVTLVADRAYINANSSLPLK